MTAKQIFTGFKKIAGPDLSKPARVKKATTWATLQLVEGYNEIQKTRPAKNDPDLFALFDFMNLRANKLRFRINAFYKIAPGREVMKAGAFNEILKARVPDAYNFYRQYKGSPAEYFAEKKTPLNVVK